MRGLTVIEKHKKWGWVGVTGNRDSSCTKPKHLAAEDLAATVAKADAAQKKKKKKKKKK